jgi:hypothetical protein
MKWGHTLRRPLNAFSLIVFITIIFSAGCFSAKNYNYRDIIADISSSGTASIGVAVHDQRDYVQSGNKRPDFVGLARGGFGNPFSVSTLSGRPLADDMTDVITASLAKKGYKAVPVTVLYSDSQVAVLGKMKAARTDRTILLTMNEWKSDLNPYHDVTLIYDVQLALYDRDGKILAEKKIDGRDSLGGDSWGPAAYARRAVPEAFKKKIEELLNSPDIAKVLQ